MRPGIRTLGLAACLLGAAGCWSRPLPVNGQDVPKSASLEAAAERVAAFGSLHLEIRWPEPASVYRAAVIPTSTNALYITVTGAGSTVATRVLPRPAADATSSVDLVLEEGANYGVTVKAYRDLLPDGSNLGGATLIAQGLTAGVNIVRGVDTNVRLVLVPLFVPAIQTLSVNAERTGQTVTIGGSNLGPATGASLSVSFNGTAAGEVTLVDGNTVRAVVPAGATVGPVVVRNDNVASVNNPVFWVLSGIAIDAPRLVPGDNLASGRMVPYGGSLQFSAAPGWSLAGGSVAGDHGIPPALTWSKSGGTGVLNSAGLFLAPTARSTSDVSASLNSVRSNALTADPRGVDALTLDRGAVTLIAAPPTKAVAASYAASMSARFNASLVATLPISNGVAWTSSDPTCVLVDATGRVSTTKDAAAGTVVVQAEAIDDRSKRATASITVVRKALIKVGID